MTFSRKILHIDMDAFYASVEQRDNPSLRGKPVVVGGRPDSRGVVAACSYEARQFGIHSAMASSQARRLCADLVFVAPRFSVYREVSQQIHAIFSRHSTRIEPLALDEAYIDVTDTCERTGYSATDVARSIKSEIQDELKLVASAGVSYNKFLAKIASDYDKPDGLYVIRPEQGQSFVDQLPVKRFHGIGKVTDARLQQAGIYTGKDFRLHRIEELQTLLGKSATFYHKLAHAIDDREVTSNRVRKSIGAETTFETDLVDTDAMRQALNDLSAEVFSILSKRSLLASTVTIKVRYPDFQTITRSYSLGNYLQHKEELYGCVALLLERTDATNRSVRLLGVSLSGLMAEDHAGQRQLTLPLSTAPIVTDDQSDDDSA